MTLDLRKAVYKPLELKLDTEEGEITLCIPAPTKTQWEDYVEQEAEYLKKNKYKEWNIKAALLILNCNSEGKEFEEEDLDDMPMQGIRELVKAYVGWVQGTLKN